jgi:arylsulfatase A-like enzyme
VKLIKWPAVAKPRLVSEALISQIDIVATLAAALDFKFPNNSAEDSHNLLPLLKGEGEAVPTTHVHNTENDHYAMARLAAYYAMKIRGSAELALFEAGAGAEHQQAAIRNLTTALERWKAYADIYSKLYRPQLLACSGQVDISGFTQHAAAGIFIARDARVPRITGH